MKHEDYSMGRYVLTRSDSQWADPDVIRKSASVTRIDIENGDCPVGGIPIISDGRAVFVDGSDTHTIVFGSTGSKKTRLFALPLINILSLAGESFIATDPKGELYARTSGLVAAKGYETAVFNLRDLGKSDHWNPLYLPHNLYHSGHTEEAISSLNDFLESIAEPHRKGAKDPYWINLSMSLALAHLLFFIDTTEAEEANIANFAEFCATKSTVEDVEELFNCIPIGSIASTNYKGVLGNKDAAATWGNVVAGVHAMLNVFVIRKSLSQVLSKCSFDVRDIGKKKTAIYIIVPDEKTSLHFMVTAFIKQVYETMISEAQLQTNLNLPLRVNFVLDEFCNIPGISDMPSMISAARSRNMRFFLFAQGLFQMKQVYGDDAYTIKGNCDNWVFLTSREYELLKQISDLCGDTYYRAGDGSISSEPLISTSDLQRLSKEHGEALILHGRNYPFVTRLPDIDDYDFESFPPVELAGRRLPRIKRYDVGKVISEIKERERPVPFAAEVSATMLEYEKSIDRYSDGKPLSILERQRALIDDDDYAYSLTPNSKKKTDGFDW